MPALSRMDFLSRAEAMRRAGYRGVTVTQHPELGGMAIRYTIGQTFGAAPTDEPVVAYDIDSGEGTFRTVSG